VINIDWDEYKEHKKYSGKNDNFEILIDFMKSYYNIVSSSEMYETFSNDDIALMMLEKRGISSAEALEDYIFKLR